jgi:hypothetical protein
MYFSGNERGGFVLWWKKVEIEQDPAGERAGGVREVGKIPASV